MEVPIEKAFKVFVERMSEWWPATHHIAPQPFSQIVVERHAGGRWFERDAGGSECEWGRVLLCEPPSKLILSWHLQPDWKFDPDPARASEVALEFIAEAPTVTRLEFEHRYLERHGEGYEKMRTGVDSPGGWTAILTLYAEAVKH